MYKALIFDLDGTAIPNRQSGRPSANLIAIVRELQKTIKVSAATGRSWAGSKPIIQSLDLRYPCIISGGTQIIDPLTAKILWEKAMSEEQVAVIMKIVSTFDYSVSFSDDLDGAPAKDKIVIGPERIIYIFPVTPADTEIILARLKAVPDIIAHKVMSWTPGNFDIHITHSLATKSYAMVNLLSILGLKKEEVVAAGDSDNDLPLFEAAGYKIAMANGSDELKSRADLIAPGIDEDGLVTALKRLFL